MPKQKKCSPDLLAALRLISDEVPDNCTPSEAWAWVRPVTATGQTFPAWSFCGILAHELKTAPAHGCDKAGYRHALIAGWIRNKHAEAVRMGRPWPPTAVTTKPTFQPTPWDGKDEKPGAVPKRYK